MLKPVGFWSYTRQDDAHSDGRLSQLRLLLGNAIGLRQGEQVRFFQDTEAIRFGADWAASIEDAIAEVTFFIPVVTPAFLKSKHCCDEFRAFRHRMEALGRDDLIFPIHYVDLDGFGSADSVFGEDFAALHRSQWADYRPLIYQDLRSPRVKQWADRLASDILTAMRHDKRLGQICPPPRLSEANQAILATVNAPFSRLPKHAVDRTSASEEMPADSRGINQVYAKELRHRSMFESDKTIIAKKILMSLSLSIIASTILFFLFYLKNSCLLPFLY
jgi:hypothetical protein